MSGFFLVSRISINGCATGYFILNFRFLFLLEKIYGWQHQYVVLIRTTSCGNPDNKLWLSGQQAVVIRTTSCGNPDNKLL